MPTIRALSVFALLASAALVPAAASARPGAALAAVSAAAVEPARAVSPASDKPDPERLRDILASAPGRPTAFAHVIDLDTGRTVVSIRGDKPVYPASVSKMFTTAATLRSLSPRSTLNTDLLLRRGKLRGKPFVTLSIVGSGDPSLLANDTKKLAARVRAAGISRVDKLVVDDTVFDRALPRGYDEKQTDAAYRAPVGGLQINSSAITLVIARGPKAGAKPTITTLPESPAIVIDNRVTMVRGRGKPLTVTILGKGRATVVRVQGRMGRKRKRIAVRKRVHDASYFAGQTFARQLRDAGVQVGRVLYGKAPKGSKRIARHRSRPLVQLVKTCNQTSHNGYAESFFKLIGARKVGLPGSSAKGEQAAKLALGDLGIPWPKLKLGNGSGLYHANKVTTKGVVALLKGMDRLGKDGERWRGTLAIAGVAGTLRGRLRGPVTRRRIFAKTGTLDDVTALAGYALGPTHRYAFALFYNNVQRPARLYRRVHDRFLTALLDPASSRQPRRGKAVGK